MQTKEIKKHSRHLITAIAVVVMLLIFISSLFIYSNNYAKINHTPRAKNGVLDCLGYDIDISKGLYLEGEWEFYWNQFIVTDGVKSEPQIIKVPSSWTEYKDDNGNYYPAGGYASYRMVVKNYADRSIMTAAIENITCPYRIFVNKELIVTNGVVSTSKEDMFAYSTIILGEALSFSFDNRDLEVIIEVSSVNGGGLGHIPMLVTYYPYVNNTINDVIVVWVYLGIIVSIAAVTIIKFLIEGKTQITLSLVLVVILVIIKIILAPQIFTIIQHRIGLLSAEYINPITYIINIGMMVSFMYFIYQFISKEGKKTHYPWEIFAYLGVIVSLIISFIFNITPQIIPFLHLFSLLPVISFLIKVTNKLIKTKIEYAEFYLYSLYFGCTALLINIGAAHGYIRFKLLHPYYILLVGVLGIIIIVSTLRNKSAQKELEKTRMLEQQLNEAQNAIMFSQMKPHFIYNALNSIKYLVITGSDEAEEAIDIFSSYLRTNMSLLEQNGTIPFEKELEHIRNYTQIEKLRFGSILKVKYEITDTEFMVPPLSIQPLVENALKHGITNKLGGGTLIIKTTSDDKNYYIYIIDDGNGFDKNDLRDTNVTNINQHKSYGLRNTEERLAYMVNGRLEIDSIIGEGTKVTVIIPK